MLAPRSVAVVGASNRERAIGGRVLANLVRFFPGEIYPVNRRSDTVQGLPAYPDIAALPVVPDLAVLLVEADATVAALRECARVGVGACVVMAAGFGEGDGGGREREEEVRRIAAGSGMRILGPNCMGCMDLDSGAAATFADFTEMELVPGRVAIVSQSGAMGMHLFTQGQAQGLGVSRFVTTGNELDVTLAEAFAATVDDDRIDAIGLFLEGVREPGLFMAAARRAAKLGKPVVALKVGASASGARASISHTGSMVGADDVVSSVFDQVGIVRAASPQRLLDFLKMAIAGRIPRGNRLGIMTASGGMGILLADAAEAHGLVVPEPGQPALDRLTALLPSIGSAHNPIDVTAQVINEPDRLAAIVEELVQSPDFDAVLAAVHPNQAPFVVPALDAAMRRHPDVPVVVCTSSSELERQLNSEGMPATADPIGSTAVLADLLAMTASRQTLAAEPLQTLPPPEAAVGGGRVLPEHEASGLLRSYGLPIVEMRTASTYEEMLAEAEFLGFPVAVKVSADWMTHRSEHGGVRLGINGAAALRAAYDELASLAATARPRGAAEAVFTVAPMVQPRLELFCGAHRDPDFGPVVSVGLGGTLVEIVRERSLLVAPFTRAQAAAAVRRLAGGRLVSSVRGLDAPLEEALLDLLNTVADLMAKEPAISEIDLNPVAALDDRLVVLDSLISTS